MDATARLPRSQDMNHGSSDNPSLPEFGRQSQFPIQGPAVERAAEFLTQGRDNRERLSCADCLTAELCAAMVTWLTRRRKDRTVPEKDADTMRRYSSEV